MEKYVDEIGVGVELSDVIAFQTRLMMGAQFGRLEAAEKIPDDKKKKEILIACLRLGWNDAFRHTSKNVMNGSKSFLEIKSAEYNKEHKAEYDDYICGEILSNDGFFNVFKKFALASTSMDKIDVINNNWGEIKILFEDIKDVRGDKALCFGHFQKMFNMALKFYLCLYVCKDALGLDTSFFDKEILSNLKNADCPIDSIILNRLDEILVKKEGANRKKYSSVKWSKMDVDDGSYVKIQKAIDDTNYKSRLSFDFKEWN